jgi:hypothetical protein
MTIDDRKKMIASAWKLEEDPDPPFLFYVVFIGFIMLMAYMVSKFQ